MSKILLAFIFPIAIDLFSLYLSLRKNRKGKGASGLPIVTLAIYGLIAFGAPYSNFYWRILLLLVGIFIHVTLVFLLQEMDRRILQVSNKENKL